jgi:hypothetical protein
VAKIFGGLVMSLPIGVASAILSTIVPSRFSDAVGGW